MKTNVAQPKVISVLLMGALFGWEVQLAAQDPEPEDEVEIESEVQVEAEVDAATGTRVESEASIGGGSGVGDAAGSEYGSGSDGGEVVEDVDVDAEFSGSEFDRVDASGGWEFGGWIGAELRAFFDEPKFPGQLRHWQPSLIFAPEVRWENADGDRQVSLQPYFRLDGQDYRRTHFDLREAYWRRIEDSWDLTVGFNKIFWGVTESRHLVDIINQDDFVEDIDREDKLGQPMLNLNLARDWGTVSLFVLPGFRERTFPGREGRLLPGLPVSDDPVYESAAGQGHVDFAARYSHVVGEFDFGVSLFHGTGREPRLVLSDEAPEWVPHYDIITQAGLDLQWTRGAWLWKVESIIREGQGSTFGAAVGGFEYTRYQVFDTAADLGLLAEYLYDGRDISAPPTPFQNDLFLGTRLALNDTQDTELLAGAIADLDGGGTSFLVEFERRFGNHWTLEAEGRFFGDGEYDPALRTLANDSFLSLRLSRHF